MGDFLLILMKNRPDIMKLMPSAADNWHILARLDYDPKQDIDSNLIMLKLADYSFIESIPELYAFRPLQPQNWYIRTFKNVYSNPNVESYTPCLEYANFSRVSNIDNYRYDNTGEIRTNVLGPGFIEQMFLEQAFYLEQMFLEQMFEGNMGGLLVGIMTDCKNLFLQELILRFADCKSKKECRLFLQFVVSLN